MQQEEEKKRKIELKCVKENMWKKWRTTHGKGEEYKPETGKGTQEKMDSLRKDLQKIEIILKETKE